MAMEEEQGAADHLVGGVDPRQVAKDASKAWIQARRAARQTRIKAGSTTSSAAAAEDEEDRLQAAKAVAEFVVHFPGDGLEEEETRRAHQDKLLLSVTPAPPPPRSSPRRSCWSCLPPLFASSTFPRPEPGGPIPVGQPLDDLQLHRIREERRRNGFDGVVTCIPLLDEPVTEAYSVLGFPLWWSTRRSGTLDCVCKTCSHRMDVWRPDLKRRHACGHKEVERVCEMCYNCSDVLHPSPGEFAFGYHDPY
ncbi:hypothetical protein PR202_gb18290 [Eleusine coracana subsp. coracana]|uniref:Uncharacterized protein n=1 Tax=Eleusine coracana subsp. coracana TaxID=191504 RepID=A0AAV5F710_ELECO|nr:hypothetical protein PR202_gb18290 [Eleusine coracana subsp. coracana]